MGSSTDPVTKGTVAGVGGVSITTATEMKFLVWMVGIASLLGIIEGYPSSSLNDAFLPNDVINLICGIPFLLYSGSDALLLLPGALLYQVYSSLTYVLALLSWTPTKSPIFYFQLGAFYMSTKALWKAFHSSSSSARDDGKSHSFHINIGRYLRIYSGSILIFWGLLFVLRAGTGLLLRTVGIRDDVEAAIHVADILIGPSWMYGGWKLLLCRSDSDKRSSSSTTITSTTTKRRDRHYDQYHYDFIIGFSFLVQGSALFVALVLLLLVRPYLLLHTDEESVSDVFHEILLVSAMGLTVIIPFLWMYNSISL